MNTRNLSLPPVQNHAVNGSHHRWKVLWAGFVAYLFDSYDLMVLAIAMPVLLKVLSISLPDGGLLGSATALGAMLGSIVFGLIAENHGRRFSLVLALIWLGVGMGAVYFVNTWSSWMVLRFFTGLAIGGVWGPCSALIAEHWSPHYRARAASFVFSSFAIGAVIASLVGRWVIAIDWQLLFAFGAISIPFSLIVLRLIPPDIKTSQREHQTTPANVGMMTIFSSKLVRITLPASLVSIVNLAGFWGAAFWIPTFLTKERGLDVTTMLGFSVVMYVGMFFGFQFFGLLADKIGRRRAMIVAFLLCAVSITIYILVQNPIFLFWWGAVVGFGLCGSGGILGAYYAELFPEHVRAYAGGFCWNMGRIGAIVAPFTIGTVGKIYGLQMGLLVSSGIYLAGIIMLFLLPETYTGHDKPKAIRR